MFYSYHLGIKEKILELDQKILLEERERKIEKLKKFELAASRSTQEQQLRERIERRKTEFEKDQRRKEREEKRRLRKMNKKLERLKEKETVEKVGMSAPGEFIVPSLPKKSKADKPIQVYTHNVRK